MQFRLSSLVDLALGQTHFLDCENFTLLHTVLQILLKKTNLSDTQVELTDDLAVKARNMIKTIPEEPSVLFKEYIIRENGTKVRKRDSREVCVKRSLTQVKKRWPKCCITGAVKKNSTPVTSTHPSQDPSLATFQKFSSADDIAGFSEKLDGCIKVVNDRLEYVEKKLENFNKQANGQLNENRSALEDFMKLKSEFSMTKPVLDQLQNLGEPLNLDFIRKMTSKNVEVRVNIQEASKQNSSSEATTSDDDEASQDGDNKILKEISWLKERVGEISETLIRHKQCLRSLKCDDLKRLRDEMMEVTSILQAVQCRVTEDKGMARSRDLAKMQQEIKDIRSDNCKLQSDLRVIATDMREAKKEICDRLCSLGNDIEDRIKEKICSLPSSCICSENSSAKSLHQLNEYSSTSTENDSSDGNFSVTTNNTERQRVSPAKTSNYTKIQSLSSHYASDQSSDISCNSKNVKNVESEISAIKDSPNSDQDRPQSLHPNIQHKVASISFCLQQAVRDIANKVDRCEFEMCRRQINETFDLVMKFQRHFSCSSSAAGVSIPLMRNVNCISCKTITSMKTSEDPFLPKMPVLKYGRVASDKTHSTRSQCRSISDRNWSSYSHNISRRVGGSHTKVSKAMQVNKMRYKRLKTPLNVASSVLICKNRFRKAN